MISIFDILSLFNPFGVPAVVRTTAGRRAIGVNQPPCAGSNYPFISPTSDIVRLLGDFYLAYADDANAFVLPFSVDWLYGFGPDVNSAPEGSPTPTHAYDLRVRDANSMIVFDSTTASIYGVKVWGNNRLNIVEWQTATAVCRVAAYIGWAASDIAYSSELAYYQNITPTDGRLDPRTLTRLSRRVTSISVDGQVGTIANTSVDFMTGWNMDLGVAAIAAPATLITTPTVKQVIAGSRLQTAVSFGVEPGAGLGLAPGCGEAAVTAVSNINGSTPDLAGNLYYDLDGCLWVQRPVELVTDTPRTLTYAQDGTGSETGEVSETEEQAEASISMHNACGPCCTCDMFVRTYAGLRRQWDLWGAMATDAATANTDLAAINLRWSASGTARQANVLRVMAQPVNNATVVFGASFCNMTQCCAGDPVTFQFTMDSNAGSGTADAQALIVSSSTPANGILVPLTGTWPVFSVTTPYLNPSDCFRASFRVYYALGTVGQTVRTTVQASYPGCTGSGEICAATRYTTSKVGDWVPITGQTAAVTITATY